MTRFRSVALALVAVIAFGVSGCSEDAAGNGTGATGVGPAGKGAVGGGAPGDVKQVTQAKGAKSPETASFAALAKRVASLEEQILQQEKTHSAERELMVKALEASSSRLDTVLGALLDGKIGTPRKDDTKDDTKKSVDPEEMAVPPEKGKITGVDPKSVLPRATNPGTTNPGGSDRKPADAETGNPKTAGAGEEKAGAGSDPDDPGVGNSGTGNSGTGNPGTGDGGTSNPGAENLDAGAGDSMFADIDLGEILVIFLGASLLGFVVVIVFFPGRLRGSVPEVEYSAIEEEAIAGLQFDLDGVVAAGLEPSGTQSVAPRPSAMPREASTPVGSPRANLPRSRPEDRPVVHELTLHVDDPENVSELAAVLDRFLSTDPYILNEPSPQVALEEEVLRLRFYVLPTLSEAEHALIDDAVRRLAPGPATQESATPSGGGPRRSAG